MTSIVNYQQNTQTIIYFLKIHFPFLFFLFDCFFYRRMCPIASIDLNSLTKRTKSSSACIARGIKVKSTPMLTTQVARKDGQRLPIEVKTCLALLLLATKS